MAEHEDVEDRVAEEIVVTAITACSDFEIVWADLEKGVPYTERVRMFALCELTTPDGTSTAYAAPMIQRVEGVLTPCVLMGEGDFIRMKEVDAAMEEADYRIAKELADYAARRTAGENDREEVRRVRPEPRVDSTETGGDGDSGVPGSYGDSSGRAYGLPGVQEEKDGSQ